MVRLPSGLLFGIAVDLILDGLLLGIGFAAGNSEGMMGHGCHPGCIIKCSIIFPDENGKAVVSCIEYETTWSMGANCGIDDLDYIAKMTRECNDIGLDTIDGGNTIAIAMEAGLLEFGDAPKAMALFDEIRKGTPLGRILGQGVAGTAKVFGVHRVPVALHRWMLRDRRVHDRVARLLRDG